MRTSAPLTRGPVSLTRVAADRCRQNAGAELQSLVSEDPSVWTASGSHWQSRRPTPDAAQGLDDRLAWHAGVGRLGRVLRRVEDKEVGVDGSCLGADGEEPALPLADDVEEGDRDDREGLTFGGQAAVATCAGCSANSGEDGSMPWLRGAHSHGGH